MEKDFIKYIELEVKSYKLYKIQELEHIKRDYDLLKQFIRVNKMLHVGKNIWLVLFIIVISIIGLFAILLVFFPNIFSINIIESVLFDKFLLLVISLFSFGVLYLFIDKIHKNNSLYKMDKLFNRYNIQIDKIKYEEKIKYETLVDYLTSKD